MVDSAIASLSRVDSAIASLSKVDSAIASLSKVDSAIASLSRVDSAIASLSKVDSAIASLSKVDRAIASLSKMQEPYSGAALFNVHGMSANITLRRLHSPWIDQTDLTRSVSAMAELSAIGHALHTALPFDLTFADMLRADLGDWRKVKALPKRIFEDPIARLAFYEERGFNTALTEFSTTTFDEVLVVTRIKPQIEPEDGIEESDRPTSPSVDDILVAPASNVTAYGYLFTFERQVRLLIATELEALDGPEWFKKRVHSDTLRRWEEKRATDQKRGAPDHPLIEYADFTDYLPIIEQKNNWKEAFERVFEHKPSLQESFRRLYPLRLSAMHARTLFHADQMYVYVEVHRLLTAMRKAGRA